jgi:hypothetical protein
MVKKPKPTITKPKPRKTSQSKPPSLMQQFATKRDKVAQNAIDSAFNAAGRISKAGSKTTIKKGGPRPKRMAQPMKPKRMAKKGR